MRAVVTAKAAVRRDVALVGRIDAPGYFHRRKHVAAIHVLQRGHASCEGSFVSRASARPIEISEAAIDGAQPCVLSRVRGLDQSDAFPPGIRQLAAHQPDGDRVVHCPFRCRRDGMTDGVVAVDAVHPAKGLASRRTPLRILGDVLLHLPLRIGNSHVRDRLMLCVRCEVLDANCGVGMPVDGAARGRPAAHVHLENGRRLRVRFVIGIFANHADLIANHAPGLVAIAAGLRLRSRRHLGTRRNRSRIGALHYVHELPHAGQLGVHKPFCPLADVTAGTGDAPVRCALPGSELRVHRRVAHLSAEGGRLHPVQAAVTRQQNQNDVDGGEGRDDQRHPAHAWATEIENRPIVDRARVAPQLPPLQPYPNGDEEQTQHEDGWDQHEDDEPRVRVVE